MNNRINWSDLFAVFSIGLIKKIRFVGSKHTVNPPPKDSDVDYLILTSNIKGLGGALSDSGFKNESTLAEYQGLNHFESYRKELMNLIVTDSKFFFYKFMTATYICKLFNTQPRSRRIRIFQAVLYFNFKKCR